MSGEQVMLMMGEIEQRCTIVSLDSREYLKVIRQAAANGIAGGTIYDALLAECATKAKAEIIYTDNEKHFRLLDSEIASRMKRP
jgi:predicted nucleic acid-binding protein